MTTETQARPLSASAMAKYLACPRQYEARYLLRVDDPPGRLANVGTTCHDALKLMAGHAIADDAGWPTEDDADAAIAQAAQERGETDASIIAEAGQILRGTIHLIDLRHAIEAEERFELGIGGVEVVGYMDRLDELVGGGHEVVEYKSGFVVPTKSDLQWAPQTLIYLCAAARKAPDGVPVTMRYIYLRQGIQMVFRYSPEVEAVTAAWVGAVQTEIDERTAEGIQGWPTTPSGACAWCPVRDGCPGLASWEVDGSDADASIAEMSSGQLVEYRQRAADRGKIQDTRKREADVELRTRLEAGGENIHAGDLVARIATRRRPVYPSVESTAHAISMAGGGPIGHIAEVIAAVSSAALKRYLAGLGDDVQAAAQKAADGTADAGVTSYVDVRRRKSPL